MSSHRTTPEAQEFISFKKKWHREKKAQKRIGARRNSENSRPAGKQPGSHHKSLQMQMGASEQRKTHFVPELQATDCTRQERRKTNERDGRTGKTN